MVGDILEGANAAFGFTSSLIATSDGLLLAYSGDVVSSEEVAGFSGLVRGVVSRAERDLGMSRVDEVSVVDEHRGRLVLRPVRSNDRLFFLVVQLPPDQTWRRSTNRLCTQLTRWLDANLSP